MSQRTAVQIKHLAASDSAVLKRVAAGVFDGLVDAASTAEFLVDPRHHVIVAIDDGEVVGMASGFHFVLPDKAAELWINEVGVATARQGKGIDRRLLDALLARGRELGCKTAWVLRDEPGTSAERLYESAGAVEAPEGAKMYTFRLEAKSDGKS